MPPFKFKQFDVHQDKVIFKVNQDGVLLGAWADVKNKLDGLDIGTGSGVIALMSCQRNADIKMDAVEVDQETASQAQQNFTKSKFRKRLQVHCNSIQSFALSSNKKYDFIISNPPYFQVGQNSPTNSRIKIAKHTDLLPFEDLVDSSSKLLSESGEFHLILPYQEAQVFIELARKVKLHLRKATYVKGRISKPIERVLMTFSKVEKELFETHLVVQKSGQRHDYTDEYIELVNGFYTIL